MDHIVPLAKNGDPYFGENLQTLCGGAGGCHAKKTREDNGHGPDPARDAWVEFVGSISQA